MMYAPATTVTNAMRSAVFRIYHGRQNRPNNYDPREGLVPKTAGACTYRESIIYLEMCVRIYVSHHRTNNCDLLACFPDPPDSPVVVPLQRGALPDHDIRTKVGSGTTPVVGWLAWDKRISPHCAGDAQYIYRVPHFRGINRGFPNVSKSFTQSKHQHTINHREPNLMYDSYEHSEQRIMQWFAGATYPPGHCCCGREIRSVKCEQTTCLSTHRWGQMGGEGEAGGGGQGSERRAT